MTSFASTRVVFTLKFPWTARRLAIVRITPTPIKSTPTPTTPLSPTPTAIPKKLVSTPTPVRSIPIPTVAPKSASPPATSDPTPTPSPQNNTIITQPTNPPAVSQPQQGTESTDSYLQRKMNEYRKANGLGELGSDQATCDFAQLRAREIESDFSHAGFRSRIDSKTLPYSNYSYVNENIAQNSDFTRVIDSWINSPGHAENMRQNLSTACIRHSGEYYVFEGWRG